MLQNGPDFHDNRAAGCGKLQVAVSESPKMEASEI